MKKITLDFAYKYLLSESEETYRFTLFGKDNERVEIELNETQLLLIESRLKRSFYVRCKKERVLQEIGAAESCADLERVAKKYYFCDVCCFTGMNLYGVKRVLNVIAEALYKYPKLRSKLCFIGTVHGMEKLVAKMENGKQEVLNDFCLQYICSQENARKLGKAIRKIMKNLIEKNDGYIALAMCVYGLFDSILLDRNDYGGYSYIGFVSNLRKNEEIGFHPAGSRAPEFVVYHELGHLLDDLCRLSENAAFSSYHKSLSAGEIKTGLSGYALESPKEFIAEAFGEYMVSPAPRPIAARIGEMLDKAYAKLP